MLGKIVVGQHGSYAISSFSGEGGVGSVYKAKSIAKGQIVAAKFLHSKRFALTDVQRKRFATEIASTIEIESDYIVRGIDFGDYNGEPFLILEWMGGGTLQNYIARGDYGPEQVISIAAQLLKGFSDLQRLRLVHRDLKPNNLMFSDNRRLKLSDLGLARDLDTPLYLTASEDRLGSLLYISERQRNSPSNATARDDFYAICLILYELISRRRIHTKNPPLRFLRPSIAPMALSLLVDRGINDPDEWHQVLDDMCKYINIESEEIDPAYTGSLFVPEALLRDKSSKLVARLRERLQLEGSVQCTDGVDGKNALLEFAARELTKGFEDCVEEFQGNGVDVWIDNQISEGSTNDEFAIYFGAKYEEPIRPLLEELDIAEKAEDRLFGWIEITVVDPSALRISDVGGKRLYADTSYFPSDMYERQITGQNEGTSQFLRMVGRALAVGAAIGATEHVEDFIDASDES